MIRVRKEDGLWLWRCDDCGAGKPRGTQQAALSAGLRHDCTPAQRREPQMDKFKPYAKAIVAVLGAVLTSVMTQFPTNEHVQQWGPIISALLTALAVYVVPNKDPQATHQAQSVQPPTV